MPGIVRAIVVTGFKPAESYSFPFEYVGQLFCAVLTGTTIGFLLSWPRPFRVWHLLILVTIVSVLAALGYNVARRTDLVGVPLSA